MCATVGFAATVGHWVDEERYVAAEWFPGAARARAAKAAGKPLFASAPSFFVGMTTAPAADVRQLLEALGGRIVASPEQATICLGHPTQRTRRHTSLPGATTIEVPEQWLYGAWSSTRSAAAAAAPSAALMPGPRPGRVVSTRSYRRLYCPVQRLARGDLRQAAAGRPHLQGHQPTVLVGACP